MMIIKNNKAFTLVELIMVVSVFVILAVGSFLAFNPTKRLGETHDTQRWEDIIAIAKAVELYQIDNDALPGDLSAANINTGQKVVLCSSAGTLSCDGQSRACLVVNDDDFIKTYFGDSLPVDPQKTTQIDTGYYITRTGNDMMTFGACTNYGDSDIEHVALASLVTYTTTCGDGEVEGSEVCDDNNEITETQSCGNGTREYGTHCNANCSAEITLTEVCDDNNEFTEGCGNGVIEAADTYCNANCSAEIVIATSEQCDYNSWTNDCNDFANGWLTTADAGSYLWCDPLCSKRIANCIIMP